MNIPQSFLHNELTAFFKTLGGEPLSVLTGVSGGADSIALIHLLHEHRDTIGISRLAAAHVNHRLRGDESDGDETFVKNIAEHLGIEFFTTKLDGSSAKSDGDGMENWARNERYRFFQEIRARERFDYIATAHTANDQAETLIMRLMRGTGVRGLRGILDKREDGVIRPLLYVERRGLEEWLTARGLSYRTDSTNTDTKYRRNYVRGEIIPKMTAANDRAVSNIAACAESAAQVWRIVEEGINIWIDKHVTRVSCSTFHIDKKGLAHKPVASEALVSLFGEYGISVSRLHINRIMSSVSLSSGEHLLPEGWRFYPTSDRICVTRS